MPYCVQSSSVLPNISLHLWHRSDHWTVVDELAHWFNATTRGMVLIGKLNFPPTPHILEVPLPTPPLLAMTSSKYFSSKLWDVYYPMSQPINLLTIEAFQTRMRGDGKMNYYTSVKEKVALRLAGGDSYTNDTQRMLTHCCDFHGCGNSKHYKEVQSTSYYALHFEGIEKPPRY